MSLKAWIAYDFSGYSDDSNAYPIRAESRSKARYAAACEIGVSLGELMEMNVQVKRLRDFDDRPFGRYDMLMEGHYHRADCCSCGREVYEPDLTDWPWSYADEGDPEDGPEEIQAHRYGNGDVRCGRCHATNYTPEQWRADSDERYRRRKVEEHKKRVAENYQRLVQQLTFEEWKAANPTKRGGMMRCRFCGDFTNRLVANRCPSCYAQFHVGGLG